MIIKFAFCNQLGSHDSLIWYKACQDKKPECFELLLPILAKKKFFLASKFQCLPFLLHSCLDSTKICQGKDIYTAKLPIIQNNR